MYVVVLVFVTLLFVNQMLMVWEETESHYQDVGDDPDHDTDEEIVTDHINVSSHTSVVRRHLRLGYNCSINVLR